MKSCTIRSECSGRGNVHMRQGHLTGTSRGTTVYARNGKWEVFQCLSSLSDLQARHPFVKKSGQAQRPCVFLRAPKVCEKTGCAVLGLSQIQMAIGNELMSTFFQLATISSRRENLVLTPSVPSCRNRYKAVVESVVWHVVRNSKCHTLLC